MPRKQRRNVDVTAYDREKNGRPEHVRDHTREQDVNVSDTPSFSALRRQDRLAAVGEGGTRSIWSKYYERAADVGIFDPQERKLYADRMTETAGNETAQTKVNIRAWVDASKDALKSGDPYRVAETARMAPGNIPGEVAKIPELQLVYEWLGAANVAGQHAESALGQGNDKLYKESRDEFKSIVANIDALTRGW